MSSTLPLNSAINQPLPFMQEKYTGEIKISLHKSDPARLISAVGERISLETFTGPYSTEFRNKFSALVAKNPEIISRPEFISLVKVFQDSVNVRRYGNGAINTDDQIIKRIDYDSVRPLQGNVFTGLAIVDKVTGEIIGRAAIGSGSKPGESEFGLALRRDYHGKKIGKEAALLMSALALTYFENKFSVGNKKEKLPVTTFTATALNTNIASRKLLSIGCKPIKSLPSNLFQRFACFIHLDKLLNWIGLPLSMRQSYAIKGSDLRSILGKQMDINKLHISYETHAGI
ncbi:MAG: GNAT family N-acetyltransferase [Parachlamydiaceae bacterium]|nr:GNAT family N-acetyltransferase [Parachlamydiaceae bacterium]